MQAGVKRTVIILLCIIATIVALLFARALRPPALDPEQLARNGVILRSEAKTLQPFSLIDHQGKVFDQQRLQGTWSLLFFGYTYCPDICPTTMALLSQLQLKLEHAGSNVPLQTILVTVDPLRDTPEKLSQYVAYFNKDFIGLTGDGVETLYNFAIDLNSIFAKVPLGDGSDYLMDHSDYILLINPQGKLHAFFKSPHKLANLEQSLKLIIAAY